MDIKKFLEHSGSSASALAATPPLKEFKAARRSVKYYGNKPYQPGALTVKEYTGAHGQPVIVVANLTAKDVEEADKLVYNLVMAALTAATEYLPSGLACYDQKEVITVSAPNKPARTLKKTLKQQ